LKSPFSGRGDVRVLPAAVAAVAGERAERRREERKRLRANRAASIRL